MNNIEKRVLEKFKLNIAISNFEKEYEEEYSPENTIKWRNFFMRKRIFATLCISFILVIGVAWASNQEKIQKHFRGLGKGVDTAIEQGYIEYPEMSTIESNAIANNEENGVIVEEIKVNAKIENFVMDDLNLSTEFYFEFDEKIREVINFENIEDIKLTDLIVSDEKKRIIYSTTNQEAFNKYCEENGLQYVFGEYNENYLNNGLNSFMSSKNAKMNSLKLIYNMYSDGYPKSQKLYFTFQEITLEDEEQNQVILKGNWKMEVDVPEKMHNRVSENYKVVSCDNKDFEIYAAKVSDTGFEIGLTISNIEKPELSREISEKIFSINEDLENGKISIEEAVLLKQQYYEYLNLRNPIITTSFFREENANISYIENSNGEKFECSTSPSRRAIQKFIDDNKLNFYETFEMTKTDATDKIKLVLYYYNKLPVTIVLEKK